jgi:hypothetical protein
MPSTSNGPAFDIHDIPFSHFGSWFGISPVIAQHARADDLHLVSHQTGLHPVLRLTPVTPGSGQRADTRWRATPARLAWTEAEGAIEAVYETPDTLRLRGTGLDLSITPADATLTPFTGCYFFQDPVDGSYLFTSYETGRRYRVTVLAGTATDVTGAEALGGSPRALTLTADGTTAAWEAAVEELDSARPPYTSDVSHPELVHRAQTAFRTFADTVAPWRSEQTPAAELAAYVLWSATVRPAGFLRRPAVLMSKHWMDKVWSWDHCFNALALAPGAPGLAWDQFQLPFDHQDESGALPDSAAHSEILYNFVKPPIHGWALRRLRQLLGSPPATDELEETYRRLSAWTDFWLTARRAPGDDLPHYQHGNDSGWDNATTFDPTRVAVTADLAAMLILQLDELARLADELGLPDDVGSRTATADAIQATLVNELWDGDRFLSRPAHGGAATASASLLDLMPIVLGDRLPSQVSDRLAERIEAHLTAHGLATEHPDSPHYEPDGYWRGPIWAPATVLIEDGLRRAGHHRLADGISARFRALCETSGFAENFDALTGQGLRDRAYTWTASSYLLLAHDHLRRMEDEAAATTVSTHA